MRFFLFLDSTNILKALAIKALVLLHLVNYKTIAFLEATIGQSLRIAGARGILNNVIASTHSVRHIRHPSFLPAEPRILVHSTSTQTRFPTQIRPHPRR